MSQKLRCKVCSIDLSESDLVECCIDLIIILPSHLLFVFLYQEWPEEDYPPYANGPGYILSSDIAKFIISEFESRKLRVSNKSYLHDNLNVGMLKLIIINLSCVAVVQDGRRKYGNVG